jgi:hypothetical protein
MVCRAIMRSHQGLGNRLFEASAANTNACLGRIRRRERVGRLSQVLLHGRLTGLDRVSAPYAMRNLFVQVSTDLEWGMSEV